ncbi:PREDICTED: protein FAM133 isoform X2 [Tarenaya hassleriana]|nr:PREDICTED: protein FAM133 isoform X2 [Tarenaya hassleriana]XP_010530679.1 PREDICTED: protein FAM133 isoform X2 [Tarenaya hassleriana]
MDLETENRIAAILLREAAELRRQAEREGVRAYLEKPNVRHRPNSRFLTATVLGVQQSNKAVEVSEMWKARSKELELNERRKRKSREESSSHRWSEHDGSCSRRSLDKRYSSADENDTCEASSSRKTSKRYDSEEGEGLRDEEIETFLQSRVKRGRGAIGPRMDETGPYLPTSGNAMDEPSRTIETGDRQVSLRPEGPPPPRQDSDSSSDDDDLPKGSRKKLKKEKGRERKHKSKEKRKKRDRKKIKEEKRRKRGRD